MGLEDIISVSAIFIVAAAFLCIAFIGTFAIFRLLQNTFGKARRSEKEAWTALMASHENRYHVAQREAILKGEHSQTITTGKTKLEL